MMKGHQKTTMLHVLQGSIVIVGVDVSSRSLSEDDTTKLWHMRLRHMSENSMEELSRRGLLDGQKTSKLHFFFSIVFLGNKSELDSLQAFINQRAHLTISIQTFGDLQKYLLWEVLLLC